MRDQDPGETESRQLTDDFPDALPRYMKIELRRRTPEEQRLYLLTKLAERQADLVKECAVSAELRKRLEVAQMAYQVQAEALAASRREAAQGAILWRQNETQLREASAAAVAKATDELAGAYKVIEAKDREIARLDEVIREASAEREGFEGWRASAEEIMAAQRAEIERLNAALDTAREQVDQEVERADSWQQWGEGHKRRADASPEAVAALKVTAGDRVAVLIPGEAPDGYHRRLADLFPGVEIIVLDGVVGAIRADAVPSEPS